MQRCYIIPLEQDEGTIATKVGSFNATTPTLAIETKIISSQPLKKNGVVVKIRTLVGFCTSKAPKDEAHPEPRAPQHDAMQQRSRR